MAKAIGVATYRAPTVPKRTSQGVRNRPKNKHARKNWKRYRGQGKV